MKITHSTSKSHHLLAYCSSTQGQVTLQYSHSETYRKDWNNLRLTINHCETARHPYHIGVAKGAGKQPFPHVQSFMKLEL